MDAILPLSAMLTLAILLGARADRQHRVGEGHGARGHQCRVLAQAVAHDHVGLDAVGREQPQQCEVDGQHRRLADLRVAQRQVHLLGVALAEQVVGQALGQLALHHRVGLGEGVADDGLPLAQPAEHAHVLRALAGEEEGHLGGGAGAAEDALEAQGLPQARVGGVERREELLGLLLEVGGAGVGEHQALGRGEVLGGDAGGGHAVGAGGVERGGEPGAQPGGVVGAQAEHAAVGGPHQVVLHHNGCLSALRQEPRNVLLDDDVEVGPPEAERADGGAARGVRGTLPGLRAGVDVERHAVERDAGVRLAQVDGRRQHAVVHGEHGLEQPGGAGGALEVANLALDGAQRHGARLQPGVGEGAGQALGLGGVADAGGGAVGLDEADGPGQHARLLVGALDRQDSVRWGSAR
ncbi:MAG: hypothetical protein QM765_19115 [Myxococcales bacterium]